MLLLILIIHGSFPHTVINIRAIGKSIEFLHIMLITRNVINRNNFKKNAGFTILHQITNAKL